MKHTSLKINICHFHVQIYDFVYREMYSFIYSPNYYLCFIYLCNYYVSGIFPSVEGTVVTRIGIWRYPYSVHVEVRVCMEGG